MYYGVKRMTSFYIALAGWNVGINAIFESTKQFCLEYLCESKPEFEVSIDQKDVDFERENSEKEDILEGIPVRKFSDEYLETLAVYRKICTELLNRDTLLFHGSVIAVDGEGYLFTAKSGTGKSTHTALWRRAFGNRAEMINDDKPLLKITENGIFACGTPWNGKHRLGCNKMVPLKAICILERDKENHIAKISGQEALPMLIQQSFRTGTPAGTLKLMDFLEQIIGKTNIYRLGCNMNPEAAHVAYDGMNRGNNED